jgi:hypothetical protein
MTAKCLVALVLGVSALAPAAHADVVENSLPNRSEDGAAAQIAVPYLAQQYGIKMSSLRPDDRAGNRGIPALTTAQRVSTTRSGFEWSDAGIGAATALGAVLVALGTGLTVRRSQAIGF